jgi:hypothetical protein
MIGLDIALPREDWSCEGGVTHREEQEASSMSLTLPAFLAPLRSACGARVTSLFSLGLIPQ